MNGRGKNVNSDQKCQQAQGCFSAISFSPSVRNDYVSANKKGKQQRKTFPRGLELQSGA